MRNKYTKSIAYISVFAMLVSSLSFTGVDKGNEVKAADGYEGYNLVWSDEFDGNSLNRDNWNVEVNGNGGGNNELQYYRDNTENINVSGGTLKITAKKQSYLGKQYTSGRITTQGKKSFKYGKVEARIKLPRLNGIWPAFWMLGENISTVSWPACGEMDIMEAINNDNNVYANLHWQYNGSVADTSGTAKNVGDRTDWHVYGMEWDENTAKFYVDGDVFQTYSITTAAQMEEFRKKQFIILNVAVGGSWPFAGNVKSVDDTKLPATMEVDYVRVYQKPQEPAYDGPMIEITEDAVAVATNGWTSWFGGNGWQGSTGSIAANGTKASDGVTVNLTSAGTDVGNDSQWGAQAQLLNLNCYAGSTCTYNCKLLSNVDKKIYVKIADSEEAPLVGEWVNLKAGIEYNFTKQFEVDPEYEGKMSIKFGLGKSNGDPIANNGSAVIKISDLSVVSKALIPDPNYINNPTTTAETTTIAQTTSNNNDSTGNPIEVFGLTANKQGANVSFVWGQNDDQLALGQTYNVYIDGKYYNNYSYAQSVDYTFTSAGKHTIRVSAVLGNKETAGATVEVEIAAAEIQTTTVATTTVATTTRATETATVVTTTKAVETTTSATITKAVETTTAVTTTKAQTTKVVSTTKAPETNKKIVLKKSKIKKVKRTKNGKKAKLKLKKIANAKGYEIQISTTKKFSKKKTVTYTTGKLSKTIKKLNPKKKYYARVRAYVDTPQGTVNGKWSKVKKIKVV